MTPNDVARRGLWFLLGVMAAAFYDAWRRGWL